VTTQKTRSTNFICGARIDSFAQYDLEMGVRDKAVVPSDSRCQAKFLTCEISDFTPCEYAYSNILHIKYAEKTDD